uniref:Ig-like domain-containing protein n=1 Tax=Monopterus albus TaxID=43700 RepID=A0A3Q3QV47_MONAL
LVGNLKIFFKQLTVIGDTAVLPSCLNEPTENVNFKFWKYGEKTIIKKGQNVTHLNFMGRTDLNPKDFSLTVRKLTRQDSGDFSFLSEVNKKQRPTVTITLQVHEPITKQPDLMINSTWVASNKSCTIFLECSSVSDIGVTYTLAVRNQTQSGSKLQYNFSPEEGETTFTCTVSNTVSGMSASKTVKCSNGMSQQSGQYYVQRCD